MHYCENCKLLVEIKKSNECIFCGSKRVREVRADDVMYLTTRDNIFSGMLENIFKENNVPYLKQGGIVTGSIDFSDYNFFVPFSAYHKAKSLLEDYFSNI